MEEMEVAVVEKAVAVMALPAVLFQILTLRLAAMDIVADLMELLAVILMGHRVMAVTEAAVVEKAEVATEVAVALRMDRAAKRWKYEDY